MTKQIIQKLKFKAKTFDYIWHTADLHIHRTSRHEEYVEAFNKLHKKVLVRTNAGEKGLLVICGDIFHSKTNLTPNSIHILKEFLKTFPIPVVVIAGNHDVNLSNKMQMDALSPTIDDIDNVCYLLNSGNYKVGNIWFGVFSLIDGGSADIKELKDEEGIKIALYHGTVNGATTAVGQLFESKKNRSVKDFIGWWIILLGDIHHMQELNQNMRYPGSLIQQNFGEMGFHGVLIWDLIKKNVEKLEIKSDYGWHTLKVKDGKLKDYNKKDISEKPYIKLVVENTTTSGLADIETQLYSNHNIVSLKKEILNDKTVIDVKLSKDIELGHSLSSKLINEYLTHKKVSKGRINDIIKIHRRLRSDLLEDDSPMQQGRFRPIHMQFENMFSYKGKWEISFPEGIVGIFGDNGKGKSSIIDIIMLALYDHKLRGDKKHEIVTHGETECKILLEFEIANKRYKIYREGICEARKKRGTEMKFTTRFWEVCNNGEVVDLTGSIKETYAAIEKVIGKYKSMENVGAMVQGNNTYFVDQTAAEREKRLNNILNLDKFELLEKKISEERLDCSKEVKMLQNKISNIDINDLKSKISRKTKIVKALQRKIQNKEEVQKKYAHLDITELNDICDKYDDNLQDKYDANREEIKRTKNKISELTAGDPNMNKINMIKEAISYAVDLEERSLKTSDSAAELTNLLEQRSKLPSRTVLKTNSTREIDLKEDITSYEQSINSAHNAIEALKDHKYDPKCKYCINNKLVINAQGQEKGLPLLEKRLRRAKEEYNTVKNAGDQLRALDLIDKEIAACPPTTPIDLDASIECSRRQGSESSDNLKMLLRKEETIMQEQMNRQSYLLKLKYLEDENKLLEPLLKYDVSELRNLSRRLTSLREDYRKTDSEIRSLTERIQYTKNIKIKLVKKENLLKNYITYAAAIGRNGIPKLLRNRMIVDLEQSINSIIGEMAPFNVLIDSCSSTIRLIRKGSDISKKTDICASMGSGSEKLLIEMALRTIIATKTPCSSNLLIMDESLSYLDANKKDVLDGLFTALNRHFKTVLVISHDINVKEHVEQTIWPTKLEDFSERLKDMPIGRDTTLKIRKTSKKK